MRLRIIKQNLIPLLAVSLSSSITFGKEKRLGDKAIFNGFRTRL